MIDLVMPSASADAACIIVVCIITGTLGSVIKNKAILVWIPFLIAIPLAVMISFSECGWNTAIIGETMRHAFTIACGSMASYDIVNKTIKEWKGKINKEHADDDNSQEH